jgi:ligand-binding sensor domain-containing protein/class 3 adenylate cyclase/HD superfamily phosphodiesterase
MCKKRQYAIRAALRILPLLVCAFAVIEGFGQHSNIKFRHLSLREGLSQSSINCIFQDNKGFMWLGTQDGLNKYDGYEFTVFKNVPEDSTSLSNSFVHTLHELDRELWIGTNKGINVLDFRNQQFRHYTNTNSNLNDNIILEIIPDKDSNLWIGTSKGISTYNAETNSFQNYPFVNNNDSLNASLEIKAMCFDNDNQIWLATANHGLLLFDTQEKAFGHYITPSANFQQVLNGPVNAVIMDKTGDMLVGTHQDGLLIIDAETKSITQYSGGKNYLQLSSGNVTALYEDHQGAIWVGTYGGGVNKFIKSKGHFFSYKRRVNEESSLSSNNVISIFEDRTGVLWVGTEIGANHFDLLKQNFNHYQPGASSINSISGNIVWSIFEDESSLLWIGTNEGLNRFDRNNNTVETYLPTILVNGEKRNTSIYAIFKDRQERLWLGTDGGVYQFNEQNKQFIPISSAGHRSRTYVVMQDSKNRIWTGSKEGIVILNENGSLLRKITKTAEGGLPDNVTRAIHEDKNGNFWIGTDGGLCQISFNQNNEPVFKSYKSNPNDRSNTLSNNTILSLNEDDNGFIWIGTFGGGLNRLDKNTGAFVHYTQKDGLPNNVIYGILKDDLGKLWISTNRGIASFDTEKKVFERSFDESDGLQSNEFNVGAHYKSESGELFFGGIKGFNSFFPSNIRINRRPPQVILTDFQLFNRSVPIAPNSILTKHISEMEELKLSYADNVFSFSFAALHYSLPERNRYAYKMEGFDENWIYDDPTRKAKYTNLDPDRYVFMVKGTNSDGVWGEVVSLPIVITPPFWKIKWVWALTLLVIAAAFVTYSRSRIKRIKAQKEFLEQQVKERTKELIGKNEEVEKQKTLLEEERDKLETLLLNILPQSTVEELKKKGKATARNYRLATVMFTDFANFTKISEKLTPTELIEKLDGFFVRFDEIIEKFNVEKIKTIGDAYMCAGGIPIRNKSNPIDVVLASLEIQRTMSDFAKKTKKGEPVWGLRIGVHTGNLVAGVIGIKRFAYDIWGDTVNVASRVESASEVGRVNVSGQTYAAIKEFFICEYRGKVYAKNKGDIDMFFVNSIKPELSEGRRGIVPNEKFWEYVNLYLFSEIDYRAAESHLLNKLKDNMPKDLYYHGVHHTIDVCNTAESIALEEGVSGEELFILKAAALYHDSGYLEKYQDNEHIGVEMAKNDLPQFGFSEEQIKQVEELIYITFVENEPRTQLEKIICDADLDYLGRDDFHKISDSLKRELLDRKLIADDKAWDEMQVAFLEKHHYHTATSKKKRNEKKQQNLEEVRARLKSYKQVEK